MGIELYEPGALTLVVRAGTTLAEVERVLAAERQRLPFEVPDLRGLLGTAGTSTIGGVVAANASGPRRVQAGACRDSLIGVRFVDGTRNGIIKNGGRVMKNVTGYDLVKLMAGSHGTLGVLTEVSASSCCRCPKRRQRWCCEGLDDAAAVGDGCAALGSPFDISGAARVGRAKGTFLRVEGIAESVAYRSGQLARAGGRFGCCDVRTPMSAAALAGDPRCARPCHGQAGDFWKLSVVPI
jgi:glycolate oxidase FAD binding subunit